MKSELKERRAQSMWKPDQQGPVDQLEFSSVDIIGSGADN